MLELTFLIEALHEERLREAKRRRAIAAARRPRPPSRIRPLSLVASLGRVLVATGAALERKVGERETGRPTPPLLDGCSEPVSPEARASG